MSLSVNVLSNLCWRRLWNIPTFASKEADGTRCHARGGTDEINHLLQGLGSHHERLPDNTGDGEEICNSCAKASRHLEGNKEKVLTWWFSMILGAFCTAPSTFTGIISELLLDAFQEHWKNVLYLFHRVVQCPKKRCLPIYASRCLYWHRRGSIKRSIYGFQNLTRLAVLFLSCHEAA